jgi:hypothetical protein
MAKDNGAGHVAIHPENHKRVVEYDARYDEYNIAVPGLTARQAIYNCPWCGERFPPSQRDRWFDELEASGIDPFKDEIPEPYRSETWRL